MQEAAVLKDLLANYLSKKSSDSAAPASDPEKRSETAKKYTGASGGVRVKSTTAKPNVAALTVPREKGTAAVASAHGPSLSVTSPPVPQPTGSSLSAAEASEAHTVRSARKVVRKNTPCFGLWAQPRADDRHSGEVESSRRKRKRLRCTPRRQGRGSATLLTTP
nr:uncharacterized protein LOC119164496 [Rhipicephalus microplus]